MLKTLLTILLLLFFPPVYAQTNVEREVLLLLNASLSTSDFAQQKQTYLTAFQDSSFRDLLSQTSPLALSIHFWGGETRQQVAIPWTLLTPNTLDAFVAQFATLTQPVGWGTSTYLNRAIDYAVPLFGTETGFPDNGFTSTHQLLFISSKLLATGTATPELVAQARDRALQAGIDDLSAIVANGQNQINLFETYAIGGPHAFSLGTETFTGFTPPLLLEAFRRQWFPLDCNDPQVLCSIASEDGYIFESPVTPGKGGIGSALKTTMTELRLGDIYTSGKDLQYRFFASFDTTKIPSTAQLTAAELIFTCTNGYENPADPFIWGGGLQVDAIAGYFGPQRALEVSDFHVSQGVQFDVGIWNGTAMPPRHGQLVIPFTPAGLSSITPGGTTQVRLYTPIPNNGNLQNDYMTFYPREVEKYTPMLVVHWVTQTNEEALRDYLENLEGASDVRIESNGQIFVTLDQQVHYGHLDPQITPGSPPFDGRIHLAEMGDLNGDGFTDYQFIYPSGDRQIAYYLGIQSEPSDCRTLTAPPLDPTVTSIPGLIHEFLYTGNDPLQTGVAAQTIHPEHAAILRGQVTTSTGQPFPNVRISIKDHPEWGQTLTTCDGSFMMVVNGDGTWTVNYQKEGFLPLQRSIKTAWQHYHHLETVTMIALSPQVTSVQLGSSAPLQVARGEAVTDADGTRQATVLFPSGTQANMVFPDGHQQALSTLNVRATEYTVGEDGPQRMPAPLPPQSAYTYAVELSVDQALEAGASRVDFSQPVFFYVENFLNFPVGSIVPVGWYDRLQAAWIPSENGRVIKILNTTGDLATLDVEGHDQAASATTLASLGITVAEQQQLARLYSAGKSLWRAPIRHFTPWDCNWPYGPPPDAEYPKVEEPEAEDNLDEPCEEAGCILEAESQTLGERIEMVGTPFTLNYRSNRAPGRKSAYTIKIPLRGDVVPTNLKRIEWAVTIAGRETRQSVSKEEQERTATFIWDGKDALGRTLRGRQEAYIKVGYVYTGVYYQPGEWEKSFARVGQGTIEGYGDTRQEIILWKEYTKEIGTDYPGGAGLGGLTLDVHHHYDARDRVLYQGDGKQQGREEIKQSMGVIETVAGNGGPSPFFSGDGGLATQASLEMPQSLAFGPNGNLYVADTYNHCVREINDQGIISTIAGQGNSNGFSGDGSQATSAQLNLPQDITFGPDKSLYIADSWNDRIRRVNPNGLINTVVGSGVQGFSGDEGLATQAALNRPTGVTFGPDGNLYIVDTGNCRVRQVDPYGFIKTIAGNGIFLNGQCQISGDGGLAKQAGLAPYGKPMFDREGNLYVAEADGIEYDRVRQIDLRGFIKTVAGSGSNPSGSRLATQMVLYGPQGMALEPDGNSWYLAEKNGHQIRKVTSEGIIMMIAGTGYPDWKGDGDLARRARVNAPTQLAFGPDGNLYFTDSRNNRVRRIKLPFPGFSLGNLLLPSEDAMLLYEFSPEGRHLRTFDALTNQTLYTFTYNNAGYLTEITDLDGDITRIEREGNRPVAIVAPDGQRTTLTLDSHGYLETLTNPAQETYRFTFDEGGLLKEFTDPRQHKSVYEYEEGSGLLKKDTDAAGGGWVLNRTNIPNSQDYEVSLTSKEGRISLYQVKPQTNGDLIRLQIAPDGTQNKTEIKATGQTIQTLPYKLTVTTEMGPDPRFGMQAPIMKRVKVKTPSGLSSEVTTERLVELTDPNNPLSLKTWTEKMTTNDGTSIAKVTQKVYEAATRKMTTTTPAGRIRVEELDPKGRVVKVQVQGLAEVGYQYDERGRLRFITHGSGEASRIEEINYYASGPQKGYVENTKNALNQSTQFSYDAVGRVLAQTLPDSRIIGSNYDADGNLTKVVPPEKPEHQWEYNSVELLSKFLAPSLDAGTLRETLFSYNLDQQMIRITRPDQKVVDFNYEPNNTGRLKEIVLPEGKQILTYDATTGQLTKVTHPNGSQVSYTYDGTLLTSEIYAGLMIGSVQQAYQNDFRLKSLSVNHANPISYGYDRDGLITSAGGLTLTRSTENGLLIGTQLGQVSTSLTYTLFGELESETVKFGSSVLYQVSYPQIDKLGRTTKKIEQLGAETQSEAYGYDLRGFLKEVKQGGTVIHSWTYDGNGNRLTEDGVLSSYDAQDRLLNAANGQVTFTYTPVGDLETKTQGGQTTNYTYDTLGNLTKVVLPDGTTVEYQVDGNDRRVIRKVNGSVTHRWVYHGSVPIAQVDSLGQAVARYVYASQEHVPDYLIQGGAMYRMVTDQLGSVRLVVNAETGAIVQRLDYDAWGKVIFEQGEGFQPFGFAGGLYDPVTKLVHFGARDYDPQVGRWTTKDPIGLSGGDTNLYAYVFNDPVNQIDPSGLFLNAIAGCLISGGIELATQMIIDGKSLGCVDWWSVALETALGCNPFSKGLKAGKAAKGAACAGNSLVGGTLVHTEDGLVPIELVKVGDKVLSWDERTGERSERPVLELIQHEGVYELVKVTLEDGEQLEATSGHPFYVQGKGWNAAANLKVGDALLLHNGTTVVVATVDSRVGWERVYNFSVAGNANYFVGSGGVGVHNCNHADDITKEVLRRKSLGGDGAESVQIIERQNGEMVSRTHRVTKDNEVLHQHQNHVGKHGSERQFPDEWTGTETINAPYENYPPSFRAKE